MCSNMVVRVILADARMLAASDTARFFANVAKN
jgi:hypothetical protein